jgi:hypothetical protein
MSDAVACCFGVLWYQTDDDDRYEDEPAHDVQIILQRCW